MGHLKSNEKKPTHNRETVKKKSLFINFKKNRMVIFRWLAAG